MSSSLGTDEEQGQAVTTVFGVDFKGHVASRILPCPRETGAPPDTLPTIAYR